MKPEMLETLLLDRALGALRPEVLALLDEHLARDPEAARLAASFAETLVLARAATHTHSVAPPPALDVTPFRRSAESPTAFPRRVEWLRLAACMAIGLGLGWFARPVAPRTVVIASSPPEQLATADAHFTVSSAGLWSRRRLVVEHAHTTGAAQQELDEPPRAFPFPPKTSASEDNL